MSPRTERRGLRIAGWTAAGLLALLVAALIGSEIAGWRYLRAPAERLATRLAGEPVVLGAPFRLSLLGAPQLTLGRLQIDPAHGLPLPHLVDARDIRLGWRWADAWRAWRGAPLRLQAVHAAALDARLVREADGRASWQLGRAERNDAPGRGPPQVGALTVGRGHIHYRDDPGQTQLQIELQEGAGTAGASDPGPPGFTLQAGGRWRGFDVDLTANAGGTLPLLREGGISADTPAAPLRLDGHIGEAQLHFDGSAAAALPPRQLDGAIVIGGPSMDAFGDPLGLTLPRTPPFELEGHLRHDGGLWELQARRAQVGGSHLDGTFRYDRRATPPQLSGRLGGERLRLRDLGPAVGVGVAAAAAPADSDNGVLPQRPFDLPSLRVMDADVQIAVDAFELGRDALAPMHDLRTHLVLDGGVLRLNDLAADVAGGRLTGWTRLDGRERRAAWTARLQLDGLDVARWLQLRRGAGDAPPPLTGRLNAETELSGAGRSTAQILGTLDGRLNAELHDGSLSQLATELAGTDVAEALAVSITGDEPLPLNCARLVADITEGVLTTRHAVIDNRDSVIRIDGRVNLRDETLALRVTAKPKDFSPLSLHAPLVVAGAWTDPAVSLDGGELAGRAVAAAALAALAAPAAALLPFVEPGSEPPTDPCAVPSAAGRPR